MYYVLKVLLNLSCTVNIGKSWSCVSTFGPPAVAGRVLWNKTCPSFHPSILPSGCFLGILSLIFSKFWHGARNLYEVSVTVPYFLAPKIGKVDQKWAKNGFFNLLKNLVLNFHRIWSIMKIYIIYCVPAQIQHLGKFLFLRYGPKCSQLIRLQGFLINHISRINQ